MILSVSRRTDIPAFYFDWFLNRLRDGRVLVPNPMNPRRISDITLSPETVDFIVFWSKNPAPMLEKLPLLEPYPYYIQFTLNAYGTETEPFLPPLAKRIETFKRLADKLGPQRVIWRYSPVLLNERYTRASHQKTFADLARELKGYTRVCKVSFIDIYAKIKNRMSQMGIREIPERQKPEMIDCFFQTARENAMALTACGNVDLDKTPLTKTGCIDKELIENITGKKFRLKKDPGQRADCFCAASVDIGTYNNCLNGCQYCYANVSSSSAQRKTLCYDPDSPLLCGRVQPGDVITQRAVFSDEEPQLNLF